MARTTNSASPGSRGRRGDGSITERIRADGTVVYDVFWQFPDPLSDVARRTSKRRFGLPADPGRLPGVPRIVGP